MKKKKIKLSKNRKRWLIAFGIVVLLIVGFIVIPKLGKSGTGFGGEQIEIEPLSQEQIAAVGEAVLSTEFISDLPKKGAIGLQFYDFRDGERVWQSGFLIGKDGFLSSGEPDIILIMPSRYISKLDSTNLCEVVQEAQANQELGFQSEENNAKLLIKYAGMLKHRDCFGF